MTRSRSRALSLLTLGVLTLSLWSAPAEARRKKQEETPPPAAETSPESRSAGATASAAAMAGMSMSATTELIDAGAEPRQTLRIHPAQGAVQEVEMVLDMDMDMDIGGLAQKMDLPPMVMTMRAAVLSASPDGTMDVETTLLGSRIEAGGGDAPSEVTDAMTQSFDAMKGTVVRSRVDGTGRPLETSLSGMSDPALQAAMDSFQQNMRQGQVMLPTEAVGVGARWRTLTDINSSGIPMHAITTYTLRSVEGDHVTLDTTIEMSVDKDAILAATAGAEVRFTRFTSSGGGTVVWDLSQVMPMSTLRYTMDMVMETHQGEQAMTVGMALGMDMQMREVQR